MPSIFDRIEQSEIIMLIRRELRLRNLDPLSYDNILLGTPPLEIDGGYAYAAGVDGLDGGSASAGGTYTLEGNWN